MEIKWTEAKRTIEAESLLIRELGVRPLTARLLANRGLTTAVMAEEFLRPDLSRLHDPFLLPDMDKAAHRIADAIRAQERIFIHGDYDVDGVTSTALYVRTLSKLGADLIYRVPHRHVDGYDLKTKSISWALEQGASVVITTDCGIQAREAVTFANEQGMTVIITDHHEPGDTLPDAFAVINPHRRDSTYPWPHLAGVGVAFKTMQAVVRLFKPEAENSFLHSYLDLVACGTVADVMPLLDENRIFAYFGLEALRRTKKTGLRALVEGSAVDITQRLTAEAVAFGIAPRINAIGRLDDAAVALDLMLTSDEQEARRLVERLNEANFERQQTQKRVTAEATLQVVTKGLNKKPVMIVASPNWNTGVVGIVAGKLVDQFHRPAIVIGINEDGTWGKGSARSIPAFDMFKGVSACRDLLETCGGHAYAAGLSLTMDQYDQFVERLWDYAGGVLTEADFLPQMRLDAIVGDDQIDLALLEEWEQMEPYGEANPHPCLGSLSAVCRGFRRIGKDQSHCKMVIEFGGAPASWKADGVAWGKADEWEPMLQSGGPVELAYSPSINVYNGRRSVQLTVKDLRPAS
ncbi:MAG: single-stranded-DNA-specific exonuclease RecJ [Capsulimonadaceae bacterium]|nr:single-stranded-DNA-specific exonuclease RecJ [Capsulimonadaceae bacterium]